MLTFKLVDAKGFHEAPSYYTLKNDGADMLCKECGVRDQASKFIKAYLPDGNSPVMHKPCVFDEWLEGAKNLGEYPL